MPFNIPRDSNNKLIKSSTTVNATPTLNNAVSIGTTGQSTFASVNSLTLNGTTVTASAKQLNTLNTTPGIAKPSKAMVLDSSLDITGINSISCNSMRVNGTNITASMFSSGVSNDASNPYLTDITAGKSKESKALIFDSTNNISNINSISTNSLTINNSIIKSPKKNINLNSLTNSCLTTNFDLCAQFAYATGQAANSYISGSLWSDVCWSPELSLYVAVSNGCVSSTTATAQRIMTSNDGYNWTLRTAPSNTNLHCVCWSSQLGMFIAGGVNIIIKSSDGINWTSQSVANTWNKVCWSPELNIFVAISGNNNNSCIVTSSDGNNWTNRIVPSGCKLSAISWSPELNLFVIVCNHFTTSVDKVITSTNGINWTLVNAGMSAYLWACICWSAELNMFLATSTSTSIYMTSSDGFKWNLCQDMLCNIFPTCICWSKDLQLFIAIDVFTSPNNNCNILYSPNGYIWYRNSSNSIKSNNEYTSIIWNSEYKQFLTVSGNSVSGTNYDSNTFRVVVLNSIIPSSSSATGSSITFSNTNKYIGINSSSPSVPLEINSTNGNCFKQYYSFNNTKYITYDILSTGQFNITTPKYFCINTDSFSYGLMLNNTIIKTTANEFNTYLTNNTPGTATASKLLMVNSDTNISGINVLSCNSLTVNGSSISAASNSQYFVNSVIGSATASSAILAKNNNIASINNISSNKLLVNSSSIINSTTPSVNLTNLKDQISYSKYSIQSALSKLSVRNVTTGNFRCGVYSPELGIFVAGSQSSTNSLSYSKDSITWVDCTNQLLSSQTIYAICWSPHLMMFIASSTSYLLSSFDGINWNITNCIPEANTFNSICWSSELKLFVAVASSGAYRVAISYNGYDWYKTSVPNAYSWRTVCWCNTLGLFIAGSSDAQSNNLMSSPDGITWTSISKTYTYAINCLEWSEELNMIIAVCGNNNPYLYSYDGITWIPQNVISGNGYTWQNIKWISDLGIFVAVANTSMSIAYSYDGINWNTIINSFSYSTSYNSIMWSPEISMIVIAVNGGTLTTNIITSDIFKQSSRSCLKSQTNEFVFDNINGQVGLGLSPTYQLHLSSDSAAKPSTSTWTVSSDERLKENIQNADLDMCYNNIKNLRLVKYTWKDDIYSVDQVADRSKLGWIAQEVEQIYPKAVEKVNMHGYEDCRTLNTDQIIASMYGCAKKIINNFSTDDSKFDILSNNINTLETFLNSLPDE